jgi:hypothetical protein
LNEALNKHKNENPLPETDP